MKQYLIYFYKNLLLINNSLCFRLKQHPSIEISIVNIAANLFDTLADSVDLINEVFSKQVDYNSTGQL